MTVDDHLKDLPSDSQLRDLLPDLVSPGEKRRVEAYHRASAISRSASRSLTEAEAHVVLRAAATLDFPLPTRHWEDGFHEVLFWLLAGYPSLPPLIAPAYARQTDARRRSALLSALGATGTREAAEAFMACLREHGWPASTYQRVWTEMANLMRFPEVMLPDVLLLAGPHATAVGDVVIQALGSIDPKAMQERIEPLAPYVAKSLKSALSRAVKMQQAEGIAWRFAEKYRSVRHHACMLLDFAGYMKSPKLTRALRQATELADPRLVLFAALSLLRRGEAVEDAILLRCAACHETRAILFIELEALGLVSRFPAQWRTWEAFAASAMVQWLMYPAELGREPDQLELMHTQWVDRANAVAVHAWQFRGEDALLAAVSGPYSVAGDPRPLQSVGTFSRFEPWESASPEAHIERCLGTVEQILQNFDRQEE